MVLVKLDQKMRVRLPKHITRKLKLKGKETLDIEENNGEIRISLQKEIDVRNDPILRDMIERPLHSKVKITRAMLEKIEEDMWVP